MKTGAVIETPRLILGNWTDSETDRSAFHRLNSDEQVMRFFPYRRTRAESDAVLELIAGQHARDGFGWGKAELRQTGEVIAFLGMARVEPDFPNGPGTEVGWRFLPEFWGKGLASEAARALLGHGFGELGLTEIMAFAVPQNLASLRVMQAIGMRPDPACDFDHPRVPDTHPDLRRHVVFRVTQSDNA